MPPSVVAAHKAATEAQEAATEAQNWANKAQRAANRAQRAAKRALRAATQVLTCWGEKLSPKECRERFDTEHISLLPPKDRLPHGPRGWRKKSATARACACATVFGRQDRRKTA